MSSTKELTITVSSLAEDLRNGLTWFKKDDIGYGSIQEKYEARDFQISMISQHPKLKGIVFEPPVYEYNIVDDTNVAITDDMGSASSIDAVKPVQASPAKIQHDLIEHQAEVDASKSFLSL